MICSSSESSYHLLSRGKAAIKKFVVIYISADTNLPPGPSPFLRPRLVHCFGRLK
jgi:hypothetical protein